jgi:hypothetical protein
MIFLRCFGYEMVLRVLGPAMDLLEHYGWRETARTIDRAYQVTWDALRDAVPGLHKA